MPTVLIPAPTAMFPGVAYPVSGLEPRIKKFLIHLLPPFRLAVLSELFKAYYNT